METFAIQFLLFTICFRVFVETSEVPTSIFVETVADYPTDAIRQALLQTLPKNNKKINPETMSTETSQTKLDTDVALAGVPPGITKVYGCVGAVNENWSLESPVCETTVQEMTPRKGLSTDLQERLIVNDQLYQQKIYTQMCKYKDVPCSEIQADLRSGYQSICIQSYAEVELLTFQNDSLTRDVFQLPVSCDCYLKSYLIT